jgi:hypothetical protein
MEKLGSSLRFSALRGLGDSMMLRGSFSLLSCISQAARNPSAREIIYPIPDGDQALHRLELV